MRIWEIYYVQTGNASGRTKYKNIDEATQIMVIAFITCISTSGDADTPQMGNRKSKAMAPGTRYYERVVKAAQH